MIQRTEATLTVPDNPAGHAFADLFAGGDIALHLTADFRTAAWRKLCLNVAGGAITALTDRSLEVMRQPDVARLNSTGENKGPVTAPRRDTNASWEPQRTQRHAENAPFSAFLGDLCG